MTPSPTSRIVVLRNAFISGALLLAPLVVTAWLFIHVVGLIGGTFRPLLPASVQENNALLVLWDLLITLVVVALVTALGFVSREFFGKFFLSTAERFVLRIPVLSAVYGTVKQIVDTFSSPNRQLFSKVVMVEFPRPGTWVLGFLTGPARGELGARATEKLWSVFVPTTPNPTSGFLLLVPTREVIELDMTVGEGMKMIISGGAVVPPWPAGARSAGIAK